MVACLLLPRCPPHVSGFVVAFRVNAVQRVALWAYLHIAQKSQEVVPPLCAYADSFTAVIAVVAGTGAVASGFHVIPRSVCSARPTARTVSMLPLSWYPSARQPTLS